MGWGKKTKFSKEQIQQFLEIVAKERGIKTNELMPKHLCLPSSIFPKGMPYVSAKLLFTDSEWWEKTEKKHNLELKITHPSGWYAVVSVPTIIKPTYCQHEFQNVSVKGDKYDVMCPKCGLVRATFTIRTNSASATRAKINLLYSETKKK